MLDPDAKPKITAYTIESALMVVASADVVGVMSEAGSQNVRDVAEQMARVAIMLLNRPSLSARRPGTQRPMQLPALKMATSWYANAGSRAPVDVANVARYVIGINNAHSIAKIPTVRSRYDLSRKMRKSGRTD